jgi:hypothetical protein
VNREQREAMRLRLSTTELRDYPELEGLELALNMQDGRELTGIVAGCCHSVGITIVNKEDKSHDLICLNGRKKDDVASANGHYDDLFAYIVQSITNGQYEGKDFLDYIDKEVPWGDMSACAFR